MTGLPEAFMVEGGSGLRARIFRHALANGRTVSVGYRKGGMLEVRDLTGMDLTLIRFGVWLDFDWYTDDEGALRRAPAGAREFYAYPNVPVALG